MGESGGGLRSAAGWLAFPVVPTLLATTYHGAVNLSGADPRRWEGWAWAIFLGPLWGYAFLAGATAGQPDDPSRRGWRSWPMRRSAWVAVGPWAWPLAYAGLFFLWRSWAWALDRWMPRARDLMPSAPAIEARWVGDALTWTFAATLSHGWLVFAWLALRRAHRLRRLGPSILRGLVAAAGFVGSLVGGFWAATAVWRDYFFDPRVVRVLLVAGAGMLLTGLGGCGSPTVGDVRRRRLFEAMLTAWVAGLALLWRWLGRRARR